MNKIKIEKNYQMEVLKEKNKLIELLAETKKIFESSKNKSFINPLKNKIMEELKTIFEGSGFNLYLDSYNKINIYKHDAFYIYNFNKFFIKELCHYMRADEESKTSDRFLKECYKNINISIDLFFENKKIDHSIIDPVVENLKNECSELESMLKTFDHDILKLESLRNEVIKKINDFNDFSYYLRSCYSNDRSSYLTLNNDIYFNIVNDSKNCYLLINKKIDVKKLIDELLKSDYFKNNYSKIYDVEIIKDDLIIKFFRESYNMNIIFDLKNYKIRLNCYDDLKLESFDRLERLSDQQFSNLEKKAHFKALCINSDQRLEKKKNISFKDENIFTSTSDLHGFYFSDNNILYYDDFKNCYCFLCIAFLDGSAVAVFENQENDKIIIL